ncbi:hypothetical protein EHP00_2695 [Ecytonucleospora hepatopenaei]|uniref:Skiv2l2 n=1 Tax=Ecytonucleospora hepatopenaei TaxID=646526 RepID=A0A1W0E7R5_9MICR|nr:Skiv2l2 [Ecytonucleospora hepatopenaei]OQS55304.1 hypothetical protein EHP00_2695 [Ecytonucleospora hepatopenaei]
MNNDNFLFDEILNDNSSFKCNFTLDERCVMHSCDEFIDGNTKHQAIIPDGYNYTKLEYNSNNLNNSNLNNSNLYNSNLNNSNFYNDNNLDDTNNNLNNTDNSNLYLQNIMFKHKAYPFELDTFQKIALAAIEADRSLLVSAHTSCGKTVVAEYAIAKSLNMKQRVIYTSPIKALSNQKYRELQEEFTDVGLMTGDVTLNPEATVLVMTTEILRNMLYRGSELIREIHWIIFDEIHYLKDRERGVVWEETLILLKNVKCVFLSATIPNAQEFAEWICKLSGQVVHVIYTEKRVIPLEHWFYSDKMYLVKKDNLDLRNVNAAMENPVKRTEIKDGLISCLENVSLPAVVFSFARAKCEFYAQKISHNFLTREESTMVETIFDNAIASLSNEDQSLPAVQNMRSLFVKGVGVHHSGLLPIVKEIGEILFQEELIKVLFATESFSIGLNMPAKTVIFTALKKFDGRDERVLSSSEYCQMSGRAGRRGKDTVGHVVSILSEKLPTEDVVTMFKTSSDELKSAFRLTYNMLLNLMRVEELDPTFFLEKSFYHYQAYSKAIKMEKKLLKENEELSKNDNNLDLFNKVNALINKDISNQMQKTDAILNQISSYQIENRFCSFQLSRDGHFIRIFRGVVKEIKDYKATIQILSNKHPIIVDVPLSSLLDVFERSKNNKILNFYRDGISAVKVEEIKNTDLITNSTKNIDNLNNNDNDNTDSNVLICYNLINDFLLCGICLLCGKTSLEGCDLKEDRCMETSEECFIKNIFNISFDDSNLDRKGTDKEYKLNRIFNNTNYNSINNKINLNDNNKNNINFLINYRSFIINNIKRKNMDVIRADLRKAKEIYHMEECKKMIGVLRDLDYLDGNAVQLKGKMASEISSADEILLTEMIFNSSFNKLDIVDMVALISILVTERSKEGDSVVLSDENLRLKELFDDSVVKIVDVMVKNKLEISLEEYTANFNYYMMDIVKLWMSGVSFGEICQNTKVFEGSIIRAFKRLEEVLRQLSNAATVIGNYELVNLFGQGIYLIKRDIVFANSLYL